MATEAPEPGSGLRFAAFGAPCFGVAGVAAAGVVQGEAVAANFYGVVAAPAAVLCAAALRGRRDGLLLHMVLAAVVTVVAVFAIAFALIAMIDSSL